MKEYIRKFLQEQCGITRIASGQEEIIIIFYNLWMDARKIDSDKEIFVPSTRLKKLSKRKYQIIRDACCVMKGYSSHLEAKCNLIVGWTASFDALCFAILKHLVSKGREGEEHYTGTIRNLTIPGADTSEYMHTENSQYRWYHNLQNLDKEQKAIVFDGSHDFDIQACFPSIFHNNCSFWDRPEEYDTMIEEPELFLQKIIDDDCFTYKIRTKDLTPRQKAKCMRSRLFNPPRVGKLQRTGIQWYDNLADWILETLQQNQVFDAHNWFTQKEQEYVEKAFQVIGHDNIRLRMHDGFISKPVDCIDTTLQRLKEVTNLNWTCKPIADNL